MLIYYFQLLLVLFIGVYEISRIKLRFFIFDKITKRKQVIVSLFLVLVIFAMIRKDTTGADLLNYKNWFLIWRDMDFSQTFNFSFNSDIGYVLLNWMIGNFTTNFYVLMAIISLVSLFLFLRFYSNYSYNIWLSIYLFISWNMISVSYNLLRQVIAMAIIYQGIGFIKSRKLFKYLMVIFIAILFHKTAIICFPMYILGNRKINKYLIIIYVLSIFFIVTVTFNLMDIIVKLYPNNDHSDMLIGGKGWKLWLMLSLILILSLLYYRQTIKENKSNIILYNIMIMTCIIQVMSFGFPLLARLTIYYSFALTVLIPNVIHSIKSHNTRMIATAGVIIMGFLFFMFNMKMDYSGIVPYNFLWN